MTPIRHTLSVPTWLSALLLATACGEAQSSDSTTTEGIEGEPTVSATNTTPTDTSGSMTGGTTTNTGMQTPSVPTMTNTVAPTSTPTAPMMTGTTPTAMPTQTGTGTSTTPTTPPTMDPSVDPTTEPSMTTEEPSMTVEPEPTDPPVGTEVPPGTEDLEPFSFFVTSLAALQALSGSPDGFGGDLSYGQADGLAGADKICGEIAERSMVGASAKQWRAFLSTASGGPDDGPIHAKDRIGEGPWYDRLGRVIALDLESLLQSRPEGADPEIIDDLPNEDGVPNHAPDGELVDNHDTLTGSNSLGELYTEGGDAMAATCNNWTSKEPSGKPRVGHPWPTGAGGGFGGGGFGGGEDTAIAPAQAGGGFGGGEDFGSFDLAHWISALDEAGCAPGVFLVEMGAPMADNPTVGSGGGYGAFYCFALTP